MATTTDLPQNLPSTKPRRKKPGRRVLISCVEWDVYEQLLKVFQEKRNLRLTYDRGDLEIMVPSHEHESNADFLARMIVILTEEFGIPIRSGGSTTLKRKKMKKGLEPDRCFWTVNASKLAGVRQINLKIHPPPDLAIEVDVTSSSLDRFGIYRTLGVPELWRLDGADLRFHTLGTDKKYTEVATTPMFAGITPGDLMSFVKHSRGAVDENLHAATFRAWLRQRLAASAASPPASPPPPVSPPTP